MNALGIVLLSGIIVSPENACPAVFSPLAFASYCKITARWWDHRKRVREMSLGVESRHVGSVYVVRCAGRIVTGQESKTIDEVLQRGLRLV